MKRTLVAFGVFVAAALGVITVLRHREPVKSLPGSTATESEKERIRTFWESYNRANALRVAGHFAQAAEAYRECLRQDPQHQDSLYYLGTSLAEAGEYQQAASTFRRLIALNPSSGRAYAELGNIFSTLAPGAPADFARAREAYHECIRVNREQAGPFLHLGILALNERRFDRALENFRIASDFGAPEGRFYVAYVLYLKGSYAEAVAPLREVLLSYEKTLKAVKRGMLSEGDVVPAPGRPLTPLEKAALESMVLLYWLTPHLGGYPAGIPAEFHIRKPLGQVPAFQGIRGTELGFQPGNGRAAWGDFDKGGHADLLLAGPGSPLKLYRNAGGRFRDVTAAAGLGSAQDVWEANWVDYDRDGHPDIYLIRSGPVGAGQNELYHNNGDGTFSNVTTAMGLRGQRSTIHACFADFDGDGRMDLLEVGASDATHSAIRFFHNVGNRFVEETRQAGVARGGTAVDCAVADTNRDGRPDLFVLFWRRDAVLFRNEGRGRFSDATAAAGLGGLRGDRLSAVFFDYNRDGWPDLLVTAHAPFVESVRSLIQADYRATQDTPRLFRNLGNGKFEDVTAPAGLNHCYGTMQAVPADFDSDGWPDLLLVNGGLDATRLEPSVILRNLHGKEFREWSFLPAYDAPANFLAAAVTDINHDGRPDILFSSHPILRGVEGFPALYVSH